MKATRYKQSLMNRKKSNVTIKKRARKPGALLTSFGGGFADLSHGDRHLRLKEMRSNVWAIVDFVHREQ